MVETLMAKKLWTPGSLKIKSDIVWHKCAVEAVAYHIVILQGHKENIKESKSNTLGLMASNTNGCESNLVSGGARW